MAICRRNAAIYYSLFITPVLHLFSIQFKEVIEIPINLDEMIEVVELSMDEVNEMVKQGATSVSPPACLLGILWFLHNKCPK